MTGHIPSGDNPAKGEGNTSDSFLELGHGSHLPAGQKFMVQKVSTQLFSFVDSIVLLPSPTQPHSAQIYHAYGEERATR